MCSLFGERLVVDANVDLTVNPAFFHLSPRRRHGFEAHRRAHERPLRRTGYGRAGARSTFNCNNSHCWLCTGAAVPHFTKYGCPDELLLDAASSMNCSVV